jgi:hypothetical protein
MAFARRVIANHHVKRRYPVFIPKSLTLSLKSDVIKGRTAATRALRP